MNQDLSRFYAPNSDFYSEIQELTQILLRISEEKIGGWSLCHEDEVLNPEESSDDDMSDDNFPWKARRACDEGT